MPNLITVGVSDCKISADPDATITTYALGSCLGITLYDPIARVGGLLHAMLPTARPGMPTVSNPFMFVDLGIAELLRNVITQGGVKARLVATASGGANMLNTSPLFDVGKKNSNHAMEVLKLMQIPVRATRLGGCQGRSASINLETGFVTVSIIGGIAEII